MDKTDIKILKILQADGRISMKNLGRKVNLTSPAVSERVKKLEDKGIIAKYKAVINPKKLGLNVESFIEVTMRPSQQSSFKKIVQEDPRIVECHHMTGSGSMTIRTLTQDTKQLELLLGKIQKIGATKTSIILSSPLSEKTILPQGGDHYEK